MNENEINMKMDSYVVYTCGKAHIFYRRMVICHVAFYRKLSNYREIE